MVCGRYESDSCYVPAPTVLLCCSGTKDGNVGGDTDRRNRGCVVRCARGLAAGVMQF